MQLFQGALFKGPKYGAYTELYAGLSSKVRSGDYIVPWGRPGVAPGHLNDGLKPTSKVASTSSRFYDWCEKEVSRFI
jgi:retinol dehydrogenase-12